jgi:hypothetical protein
MNPYVLDIIGILLALIFAVTMFYHGHMILHQKNGYSQKDERKDSARMRHRIEQMLLRDK